MEEKEVNDFSLLEKHITLSDAERKIISSLSKKIMLKTDDVLIKEGEDHGNTIYFIQSGKLKIEKLDASARKYIGVTELITGDFVGELALFGYSSSSASVIAAESTDILAIQMDQILGVELKNMLGYKLLMVAGKSTGNKLYATNNFLVEGLRRENESLKKRRAAGRFMVSMLTLLSVYILFLSSLSYLKTYAVSSSVKFTTTTIVSAPLMIIITVWIFFTIKYNNYDLSIYGMTIKNWRKNILTAILFSIPFMVLVIFLKLLLIANLPYFHTKKVFLITTLTNKNFVEYTLLAILYLFLSLLQEFIFRGALQGSLQEFLSDDSKDSKILSIVVATFLFAAAHAYMGMIFAWLMFIPGLFWGWLFAKQRSLVGVCASHVFLGVWALYIVGFM